MKRRPLIHVGMPQAASTFLQEVLFPACANANRLPHRDPDVLRTFINPIRSYEDFFYSETACREFLQQRIDPDKVTVISHEGLSCTFSLSRHLIARRLHDLCPDARCLIVVRNQLTAIASAYVQRLRVPNIPHVSFPDYFNYNIRSPRMSEFRRYYYDELIETYERLFGRSTVLVLPSEQLSLDPASFVNAICHFAQLEKPDAGIVTIRKNARLGRRFILLRRIAGALLSGEQLRSIWLSLPYSVRQSVKAFGAKGQPYESELTAEQIGMVKTAFGESNARLAKRRGLDLEALGYPMAPTVSYRVGSGARPESHTDSPLEASV